MAARAAARGGQAQRARGAAPRCACSACPCRLEMLESQCTVWPDPLAAVVYAPTVGGQLAWGEEHPELAGQPIEAAAALVGAFHARVEAEGEVTHLAWTQEGGLVLLGEATLCRARLCRICACA